MDVNYDSKKLKGISIFEGIEIGKLYFRNKQQLQIKKYKINKKDIQIEINRFYKSVNDCKRYLNNLMQSLKSKVEENEIAILSVQITILEDPVLLFEIEEEIKNNRINSEIAVTNIISKYVEKFTKLKNQIYIKRIIDIKDVEEKLLNHLLNQNKKLEGFEDKIIISKEIFPSELLKICQEDIKFKGIVLEDGGETSHVALLAKAFKIPTLMDVKIDEIDDFDKTVILDTRQEEACIILSPNKNEISKYNEYRENIIKQEQNYKNQENLEAITKDNKKINLFINVGEEISLENSIDNKKHCISGIGLLRSEFIYFAQNSFPSEEKQTKIYNRIYDDLNKFGNKSMTIRTLDVGSDKKLDYFKTEKEENPALGTRGIRLTLNNKKIFKEQLRAILRTSYNRTIKVMYPMVTELWELEEAKKVLEESKKELKSEGFYFNNELKVGIMIEVPSAVFIAEDLAKHVDFFSIGTNDLTQYILAKDRMKTKTDTYNPAVFRAIKMVVDAANKYNIEVSICGEMANEPLAVIAFLSFGIFNLSMLATFVPKIKYLIRRLNINNLKIIENQILKSASSEEIKKILQKEFVKVM